jgi:methenyltetrahydrofolate cyclohydrolase
VTAPSVSSVPSGEQVGSASLFALSVDDVLRRTAEKSPYAGGGAVSAMSCASAAALVVMAARFAGEDAAALLADAEDAVAELKRLADADADAYGALLLARRLPADHPQRRHRVAEGALKACEVPLRICETGARLVDHASWLAAQGKRDLVGDVLTAAYLADASVRGAAALVQINARYADDPAPAEQARRAVVHTRAVVERLKRDLQADAVGPQALA